LLAVLSAVLLKALTNLALTVTTVKLPRLLPPSQKTHKPLVLPLLNSSGKMPLHGRLTDNSNEPYQQLLYLLMHRWLIRMVLLRLLLLRHHLGLSLMIPHHYLTAAYLLVPRTHRLPHTLSLMIILMHLPLAPMTCPTSLNFLMMMIMRHSLLIQGSQSVSLTPPKPIPRSNLVALAANASLTLVTLNWSLLFEKSAMSSVNLKIYQPRFKLSNHPLSPVSHPSSQTSPLSLSLVLNKKVPYHPIRT
jgi:hypothetical protein